MKYMRKKGHEGTVRSLMDDDKKTCYGVVGTIEDLMKEGILEYCDYGPKVWMYIPASPDFGGVYFGDSREEALRGITI